MSLFAELKRRGVIRVTLAYLAASWLLIQVADTVLPAFSLPGTALTALIIVLAVGLVPTAILSWKLELTAGGMQTDAGATSDPGYARRTARRLDWTITALLLIGIGYFAIDKFLIDPSRDAALFERAHDEGRASAYSAAYGEKSIAVLPFTNLSTDPEQEYFADGISEELLNLLAKVEGLRVISRTSAFSFKGSDETIRSIAAKLDVATILEGSVRTFGNRIRITAQLIDARSDAHLWSETYDRELDDVFTIQDEVAAQVVEQLKLRLVVGAPQATRTNLQAYMLYLQARQIVATANQFEMHKARQLLEEALQIDPGYIDAMLSLSVTHWYLASLAARDGDLLEANEHTARNEELLNKAIEADPDNATGNALMGWRAVFTNSDLTVVARYFVIALDADQRNADALGGARALFVMLGKLDLAVRVGEYQVLREPLDYWAHANLADALLKRGDTQRAIAQFRAANLVSPDAEAARWKLGVALLISGDTEAAQEQFEQEDPKHWYGLQGKTLAFFDLGRIEEHEAALAELERLASSEWPYGLARAHAWLGNADSAFHYLELTRQQDQRALQGDMTHPIYSKIKADPRWLPFLESVGQTPEQLKQFSFSPRLPPELLVPAT
jgi:TolB-like protein/Tfp pilus assembly protein PilF